jgi:3-deoxy-manno-octulosonate cytidylyltransferase (CMP-KDO synthetase)
MTFENPIVIIPSRIGSSRLPNKPLVMIHKEPLILHVWRQAIQNTAGPVVVACDHPHIARIIRDAGGHAVITHKKHQTGSDRIQEALHLIDPQGRHDVVINVQGDMPFFPPILINSLLVPLQDPQIPISTLIQRHEQQHSDSVLVCTENIPSKPWKLCVDFQRGRSWAYKHLGFYAFRRCALQAFTSHPQTQREILSSLEQLRALDQGLVIAGMPVEESLAIITVDTPKDLARAVKNLG